jgi:hypothetical protein
MSPVKYKLGFYIPEDGILHTDRRQSVLTRATQRNTPEGAILHGNKLARGSNPLLSLPTGLNE